MKTFLLMLLMLSITGCGSTQMAISPGRAPYTPGSIGFSDSFPYANGDLTSVSGGNWTNAASVSTELYVSSNIVAPSTSSNCASAYCFVVWTGGGGPAPANQSTQVTFTGISADLLGPAVRTTISSQTGYAGLCTNGFGAVPTCAIEKLVNGTFTNLTGQGATISATSTVKLTVSGTSSTLLTLYVNGSSYLTYTDSSSPITSGTWGLGDIGNNGDTHINQAIGTSP